MATLKVCIFKHQKRSDDKFPVSIRVCWKRQYAYIKTEFYVTDKQINKKNFSVKDDFILRQLNKRMVNYEELKSRKLGFKIELYTAKELAEYFQRETTPGSDSTISFIEFSLLHIKRLQDQGRKSTAQPLVTTTNAIIDFCGGREKIAITEITAKFLNQFETYLRSERTIKRENQFGKLVTTKKAGLSDISIFDYMTNVRTLFNAAIAEYNDEDKFDLRISHYPFKKYKLKKAPESKKRNLSAEQIRSIVNVKEDDLKLKRTMFSCDVFVLSFGLVGMNLIDLYELKPSEYKDGRFTYKRTKTKNRRQDKALISIKVEPELLPLIEKYKDPSGKRLFDFHKRYSDSHIFSSNVNKGLKKVAEACELRIPLSTYYARHSWATIARNDCKVSKDDINLALNHVDGGLKTTDIYIAKDWALIDQANRKILDYLFGPNA